MSEALVYYPWQRSYWSTLHDLVEQQRLPHALLLAGPEGIGKSRFAHAFGASILCEAPRDTLPCGQCQSCRWCQESQHPDVKELQCFEGKRQIGIDQVREVQGFAAQRAHREGGRKIVFVSPAEAMNVNAANALLKTLEEPAPDTLLILISHAPSRLLATIRSRCLQYAMKIPAANDARAWLQSSIKDEADLQRLLSESGGRPLAALALFETGGMEQFKQYDEGLQALLQGKQAPTALAEKLANDEPVLVLQWWLRRLQALIQQLSGIDTDLPAPWRHWVALDPQQVFLRLDKGQTALAQLQRGAALNKLLLWEGILLDWQNFCHNSPRADIRHPKA